MFQSEQIPLMGFVWPQVFPPEILGVQKMVKKRHDLKYAFNYLF
jgi:hypothetical protein